MSQVSIADSFIDAMARLDAGDAKRCASFLGKVMQGVDRSKGLRPEIIHEAADRSIRSLRVTGDLRAIAHVDGEHWLLLFVGQHDDAYAWARDRCLRCHPVTGELQIVASPRSADATMAIWEQPPIPGVFDAFSDEYLLSLGTPPEWLPTIRQVKSKEMFLAIAADLPPDASDRLVRVASGQIVGPPKHEEATGLWAAANTREWICTVSDGKSLCRLLDEHHIPHEQLS